MSINLPSLRLPLLRFSGQPAAIPASPGKLDEIRPTDILDRFVVVGDDGLDNAAHQQLLAQMDKLYQRSPFSTLFRLGDNVYGEDQSVAHNPEDGHPNLFMSRLVLPFQKLLQKGVRIYPILGNHDVKNGHEKAQLKFLKVPRYYNFVRGNTEFFALDTTVMLPGYDACYKKNIPAAKGLATRQLNWLKKALAASKAKYKVVMGHYPQYNSGRFFSRGLNGGIVRNMLEPLLVKNNVDVYLCGHEHHYERSAPIYGVYHFLSGGGSFVSSGISYLKEPPYPREKVAVVNHFMSFTETPEGLTFEAIDTQGRVIDSGVVPAKTEDARKVHTRRFQKTEAD